LQREDDVRKALTIPPGMMEQWIAVFQPPTQAELLLGPLEVITADSVDQIDRVEA